MNDSSNYLKIESGIVIECDKAAEEVIIPDGVTEIGTRAFLNCTSLRTLTIPDSVFRINKGAFWGCTSLKQITIPNGVTEICEEAFWLCKGLRSIAISESVTEISLGALHGLPSLVEITVDENNKKYTSMDGVLYNKECTELILYPGNKEGKYFSIPDGVKEIGWCAFQDCKSLKNINIPESVTEIADSAFEGCRSLDTIPGKENIIEFEIKDVVFDTAASRVEMTYDAKRGSLSVHVFSSLSKIHKATKEWEDQVSYGQCMLITRDFDTLREIADSIQDKEWLRVQDNKKTLFKDEKIKQAVLKRLYNAGTDLGDF